MYQLIIQSLYLKLFFREANIISRAETREREREAGGGGEVGAEAEAAFAVTERPLCLPKEQSILLQMAWADPAHERKKRHPTADRRSSSWSANTEPWYGLEKANLGGLKQGEDKLFLLLCFFLLYPAHPSLLFCSSVTLPYLICSPQLLYYSVLCFFSANKLLLYFSLCTNSSISQSGYQSTDWLQAILHLWLSLQLPQHLLSRIPVLAQGINRSTEQVWQYLDPTHCQLLGAFIIAHWKIWVSVVTKGGGGVIILLFYILLFLFFL